MEVYKYISQMANGQRRLIDGMAGNKEYSGAQGKVIHYLSINEGKPVYQKEIEKIFGLRPSTATEMLKGMEKNGLIKRVPGAKDGRFKEILLTEKADAYKADLLSDMEKLETLITNNISPEELQVWAQITEKMLENLERSEYEK